MSKDKHTLLIHGRPSYLDPSFLKSMIQTWYTLICSTINCAVAWLSQTWNMHRFDHDHSLMDPGTSSSILLHLFFLYAILEWRSWTDSVLLFFLRWYRLRAKRLCTRFSPFLTGSTFGVGRRTKSIASSSGILTNTRPDLSFFASFSWSAYFAVHVSCWTNVDLAKPCSFTSCAAVLGAILASNVKLKLEWELRRREKEIETQKANLEQERERDCEHIWDNGGMEEYERLYIDAQFPW